MCDNYIVADIMCANGEWTDADPEVSNLTENILIIGKIALCSLRGWVSMSLMGSVKILA